ncbi:MAG TPA: hypothetical protein VKV73_16770 [Chloroflexota bacterium]|nr:hypothetical protein [Chloroflexota bacterium]
MRSTVEAAGKVEVLGHPGWIVGGHIRAAHAVSARDVGSPTTYRPRSHRPSDDQSEW